MRDETATAQRLFARVLIAESLGRVALAIALARREPDDRQRLIEEIRNGLVVNITGEGAEQVRELMHRHLDIEIAQIEQMLGISDAQGGLH